MNKQIKFILIFSSLLFIFIIFFFGLNKSNIYTPNKVTNIEIPNFESRELFSNQKIGNIMKGILMHKYNRSDMTLAEFHKQTNKHFYILNISAKSSKIFS